MNIVLRLLSIAACLALVACEDDASPAAESATGTTGLSTTGTTAMGAAGMGADAGSTTSPDGVPATPANAGAGSMVGAETAVDVGTGTCGNILDCVANCIATGADESCQTGCFDGASPEALNLWQSYGQCFNTAACTDITNCPQCEAQEAVCRGAGVAGDMPAGAQVESGCAGYNECLGTCEPNDTACQGDCEAQYGPEAVAQFDAIIACVQANMCVTADQMLDQECLAEQCSAELDACFGPPAPPASPDDMAADAAASGSSDDLTCGGFLDCANACAEGDQACQQNCAAQTAPASLELYNTAVECIQTANCPPEDSDCITDNCGDAIEACSLDGFEFGEKGCGEIYTCGVACETSNPDPENVDAFQLCFQECLAGASRPGLDQWDIFVDCAVENMCPTLADCAVCESELSACQGLSDDDGASDAGMMSDAGDAGTGNTGTGDTGAGNVATGDVVEDCTNLYDCFIECDGVRFCQYQCEQGYSQAAVSTFDAWLDCAYSSFDADGVLNEELYDQQCAVQTEACFGEPPEPRGSLSCRELEACLSQCGNSSVCVNGCISDASGRGYELLTNLRSCNAAAYESCQQSESFNVCLRDSVDANGATCGSYFDACIYDGAVGGTNSCSGVLECVTRNCGLVNSEEFATCEAECAREGTEQAASLYNDLSYCSFDDGLAADTEGNPCVNPGAPGCETNCSANRDACAGDTSMGNTPVAGTASCREVYDCALAGNWQAAAAGVCLETASTEGNTEFVALNACIANAGCDADGLDEQCVRDNCVNALFECLL